MYKLRFLTAGESHGKALIGIIEGLPAGLSISSKYIDNELARRQKGFGRGGRMKIETDRAHILSGVRHGKTLGSPVSIQIENKDWQNWTEVMSSEPLVGARRNVPSPLSKTVTRPRPGHADLTGALKYNHRDIRNVLERSSARETAARVAVGAISKQLLSEFDINVMSYVSEIGGIGTQNTEHRIQNTDIKSIRSMFNKAEKSEVRCPDNETEKKIIQKIKKAMKHGDTLGGVFGVVVTGVPAGLGSYSQWDRKLEAKWMRYYIVGARGPVPMKRRVDFTVKPIMQEGSKAE